MKNGIAKKEIVPSRLAQRNVAMQNSARKGLPWVLRGRGLHSPCLHRWSDLVGRILLNRSSDPDPHRFQARAEVRATCMHTLTYCSHK